MVISNSGPVLLSDVHVASIISKAERVVSRITGIVLLLVIVPVLLVFLVELMTYFGSLILASIPQTPLESCSTRLVEQAQVMVKHTGDQKKDAPIYFKTLGQATFSRFVQMTMNVSEDDRFS